MDCQFDMGWRFLAYDAAIYPSRIYFQQRAYALPDSDLPQSEIDNMKMEVKFLTAYAWWQLAENYGAIPFKPDYITPSDFTLSDLMIGQSPFDEVVDYCDQQMLEAANALPAIYDDPSKYGRINKIMALTVRSRMLLFAASPLVNGNEWYKDYRNKAGELVFNPTYDPNKWVKAAEACKLCIDEAEKQDTNCMLKQVLPVRTIHSCLPIMSISRNGVKETEKLLSR